MSTCKDRIVNELTTLLSKSTVKDNEEDKFQDLNQVLHEKIQTADTIESLKTVLEINGFSFVTKKKVIVCDICIEDPYHIVGGFENKAGIFQFDLDPQNPLVHSAQTRQFLNLKKSSLGIFVTAKLISIEKKNMKMSPKLRKQELSETMRLE